MCPQTQGLVKYNTSNWALGQRQVHCWTFELWLQPVFDPESLEKFESKIRYVLWKRIFLAGKNHSNHENLTVAYFMLMIETLKFLSFSEQHLQKKREKTGIQL